MAIGNPDDDPNVTNPNHDREDEEEEENDFEDEEEEDDFEDEEEEGEDDDEEEEDENDEDDEYFEEQVEVDLEEMARQGSEEVTSALLKLPLDIFLDIFSRLPIKPLAVGRCVCKTWRTIVYHSRFVELHHNKAIQNAHIFNCSTSILLHKRIGEDDDDNSSQMHFFEHEKTDSFHNGVFVNPTFDPNFEYELVGSCNGLLCLADADDYNSNPIYVCNPVIGEYVKLPEITKKKWYEVDSYIIIYGFGFDQVGNQYKVIRMVHDSNSVSELRAEIFSLSIGKWKKLGDVPYPLRKWYQVFINGALHWLVNKPSDSTNAELILAFDMAEEAFRVVPFPPDFTQSCENFGLEVREMGGYLSIFDHRFGDKYEIWEMKEYGVKSSWVKQYVISRNVDVWFLLAVMMENGNLLLSVDENFLVCYDPTRKTFSKLEIANLPHLLNAITHVGTFISLRGIIKPADICTKHTGKWYGTLDPIHFQIPYLDWFLQTMLLGDVSVRIF